MKHHLLLLLALFALQSLISCSTSEDLDSPNNTLRLAKWVGSQGIHSETVAAVPNSDGSVLTRTLELPAFKRGLYYRPYSPDTEWAAGNRMEPVHFSSAEELFSLAAEKENMDFGSVLILELEDGAYLAVLPLVTPTTAVELNVADGRLTCQLKTWGTDELDGTYPFLAYATAADPYQATRLNWEQARPVVGSTFDFRHTKDYPEPFNYLGWCSWERFKTNINEQNMTAAIEGLKELDIPFRWFLLDDGYLDLKDQQLLSFGSDPQKFPNGLKPLTELKDEKTIKWMGIWRNFNGINRGVHKNHTMEELQKHFVAGLPGEHHAEHWILKPTVEAAEAFYGEMIGHSMETGFDFVKVDFQSRAIDLHRGAANAVHSIHLRNQALEKLCHDNHVGLLHCIAQYNLNVFNTRHAALMRSGEDYKKEITNTAITQQCFDNHLWMGHLLWGDLDSFYSSKDDEAPFLSLARAISGGPVYPSDIPEKMNPAIFEPITYQDGRILRTLAPGVPLPESLFTDSVHTAVPDQVIAPLKQGVAAIATFNLRENEPVKATISLNDYAYAGGMIQPYTGLWKLPREAVIYDWYQKSGQKLEAPVELTLPALQCALHLISPVRDGWAVMGRSDKYMGAMAVDSIEANGNSLQISLSHAGPIIIYSKGDKSPQAKSLQTKALGNGFYEIQIPVTDQPLKLTINR